MDSTTHNIREINLADLMFKGKSIKDIIKHILGRDDI